MKNGKGGLWKYLYFFYFWVWPINHPFLNFKKEKISDWHFKSTPQFVWGQLRCMSNVGVCCGLGVGQLSCNPDFPRHWFWGAFYHMQSSIDAGDGLIDLCSLQERHCWKWKRLSTTPEMSSEAGMVQMPLHVTGLASVATFMTIGSGLCMWLTPFCLTFFWSRRKVGFKGEWFFYVDWCLYFLKLWFLCGESIFPRFRRNHIRPKR